MALPNGDLITTVFDPQMAYPVDKRMQVDTLNSRDSMSMFVRWEGMEVYVLENSKKYILQGGRSNEYWKETGTGTGTGGTTFVGQFESDDLLPTAGRSAGDYAFVGTGEDFVQYNWDNISNQWVMAEGQTDMASEFFHIGYKTPLRRPVIFPLFPKDVLVQTSGDFVFAPETSVARFIFVGEVEAIRGIETAAPDREIKLVNRTGSDITLRDKASGIPTGSGFDFGGTDYTWVNGSEITIKGNGTYWELAPNNQIAFSDHLDSVNAQVSVGSDGLEVITGIFDRYIGQNISFKEYELAPNSVDGIIFVQALNKYWKRASSGPIPIEWFGTSTEEIQQAINSAIANKFGLQFEPLKVYEFGQITITGEVEIWVNGATLKFNGTTASPFIDVMGNNVRMYDVVLDAPGTQYAQLRIDGDNFFSDKINGKNGYNPVTIRGDYCVIENVEGFDNGYSTVRVDAVKNLESITVKKITSINSAFKGFVLNGGGFVKTLNINDFFFTNTTSANGSDGFLIDTSEDATVKTVGVVNIGNFYVRGATANAIKAYNAVQINIQNFCDDNSGNRVPNSTSMRIYETILNIENITVFDRILLNNTQKVTIGNIRVLGNTRDQTSIIRLDGTKKIEIDINSIITDEGATTSTGALILSTNSSGQNKISVRNNNSPLNLMYSPGRPGEYMLSANSIANVDDVRIEKSPRMFQGYGIPVEHYWQKGDIVYNKSIDDIPILGWECKASGTPGEWEPIGFVPTKYNVARLHAGSVLDLNDMPEYGAVLHNVTGSEVINGPLTTSWIVEDIRGADRNMHFTRLTQRTTGRSFIRIVYNTVDTGWVEVVTGQATETRLGGAFRATPAMVNEGTNAERFVVPLTLQQKLNNYSIIRLAKTDNSLNYTFVQDDRDRYMRFTSATGGGALTINQAIFSDNHEIIGEIEGGSKVLTAGTGVTLRYPEGQGLTAPTGSRFIVKFKSPNDALVTIIKPYTTTEILSATATLDFPTIAAGESAQFTTTVTGAAELDPVEVGAPATIYNSNGADVKGFVSGPNTVTIRIRNNGASSIDPGEGQFKIKVFK